MPDALAVTDLEAVLAELYDRGAAAHRGLRVSQLRFAEHLARSRARLSLGADAINAADLFLICASLAGDEQAVLEMKRRLNPVIVAYLKPFGTGGVNVEETQQTAWQLLLLGDVARPPRLLAYSGRGQLDRFVGVTAQRIALHRLRHDVVERRALARAGEIVRVQDDAELAIIKDRYRELFQQAVDESVGVLDDHERMILRLHAIDGLSVDRIAGIYRVSQSTISRRIAKARSKVVSECRRLLCQRLSLSTAEFESLFNQLVSQLYVSVSRI